MIVWRIRQLMAEKERQTRKPVRYKTITGATGISSNTLSKLSKGKMKHVGISTIEGLLVFFQCDPNDLMVRYNETSIQKE